ncbi:MAG: hypothetical protein M3400_11680, partial [Actinomycetota bacterium]|nr:hypothetical protein [Actinomycetota bacterium]
MSSPGRLVNAVTYSDQVVTVDISADGRWVVAGAFGEAGGALGVSNAETGARRWGVADEWRVQRVAFSPDGRWIAVSDFDGQTQMRVRVLSAETGIQRCTLSSDFSFARADGFSPDGQWVAATASINDPSSQFGISRVTLVFDAQTGSVRWQTVGVAEVVVFSPDGQSLATLGPLGWPSPMLDADTGVERYRLSNADFHLAFSPDSRRLAVSEHEQPTPQFPAGRSAVRVLDATTGVERSRFQHNVWRNVRSVAFSPDGQLVAISTDDTGWSRGGEVTVFDAESGAVRSRLATGHFAHEVAFCPDGRWVALGTNEPRGVITFGPPPPYFGWVWVFEAETGVVRWSASGDGSLRDLKFSADGRWLVTGSRVQAGGGIARVFDSGA